MSFWGRNYYNPWAELHAMQRQMDRLFDSFDDDFFRCARPESCETHPKKLEAGKTEAGDKQQRDSKALSRRKDSNGGLWLREWRPACDVHETDDSIVIHAELPGIPKEGISLKVENNVLTLSGERKQELKEEKDKYHRVERSFGKFSRSLRLPEGVDPATITAEFDNGVLHVSVPKPASSKNAVTNIEIKHTSSQSQAQLPAQAEDTTEMPEQSAEETATPTESMDKVENEEQSTEETPTESMDKVENEDAKDTPSAESAMQCEGVSAGN